MEPIVAFRSNQLSSQKTPITSFWLVSWASFLALAWLLPNHYAPWSTFHLDAWMGCVMMVMALWWLVKGPVIIQWTAMPIVMMGVACVPVLQYSAGLVTQAGNAWVSTAYLLGFLLAWVTGARWESVSRSQLADGLFLAIGMAAIVSVGLQLHAWLRIDRLDIWSMGGGELRPFANLGQPNQLGTLLLWGLLALAWGTVRRCIRSSVAIFGAIYILFGLALTGSRTAWVGMFMLVVAAWLWRRKWPDTTTPWAITGLGLYFAACVWSTGWLSSLVLGDTDQAVSDIFRMTNESRPAIWRLFVAAAMQHPWLGYGWNQVGMAQMNVALEYPALHVFFAHAHNLFLDFVLWCGLPLGLGLSFGLVWWFGIRIRRVTNAEDALLFLLLLVVMNHAMLELPLHHAYFLLPVGMVMGALDVRMGRRTVFTSARWSMVMLWCLAGMLLGLIIRDYSRVEPAYQNLRYEWANVKTEPTQVPDVLLLTQWRDFVMLAKHDMSQVPSKREIAMMEAVTSLYPNMGFFQVLAISLARNGQPDTAARWLATFCRISSEGQCNVIKKLWGGFVATDPVLAAVPWPN